MYLNKQLSSWTKFNEALQKRFGPSGYEDVQGLLAKLTQTSSVSHYQSQFEELSNRTVGLPESFLLSCFISGLNPTLRREVQISRPKDLMDAIWLARMHGDKMTKQSQRFPTPRPFIS